jgi:hypothetical protein
MAKEQPIVKPSKVNEIPDYPIGGSDIIDITNKSSEHATSFFPGNGSKPKTAGRTGKND